MTKTVITFSSSYFSLWFLSIWNQHEYNQAFPNFGPTCPRIPQWIHHRIIFNFRGRHKDILYLSDTPYTSCLSLFPVSVLDCPRFLLMMSHLCDTGLHKAALSKYHTKINVGGETGPEANKVQSDSKVWEVVQCSIITHLICI